MGRKRFAYNELIAELGESGTYRVSRQGRLQRNFKFRPGRSGDGKRGGGVVVECPWHICDPLDGKGYRYFSHQLKRPKAHRLIYWLYYGSYDLTLEINHKDGNGLNNMRSNLELVNAREQSEHAFRTGLNPAVKLTREQVREIRRLHRTSRITMIALGKKYNVTPPTIRAIIVGKTWKWLK